MANNSRRSENKLQHKKNDSFFVTRANRKDKKSEQFNNPSKTGSSSFFVKSETRNKFNKNSKLESQVQNSSKKPFDKKKWRLQKYSKKYKLEQWEDKRKKAVLREYYRSVKDDEPKFDVKKIYKQYDEEEETTENKTASEENENNLNTNINEEQPHTNSTKKNKKKAFNKAHSEFLRIKEEKQKKIEEVKKVKAEREEALAAYKQKKKEKFKKLNKKTRKGQPIMKERMELLLEQIQKSINQDS